MTCVCVNVLNCASSVRFRSWNCVYLAALLRVRLCNSIAHCYDIYSFVCMSSTIQVAVDTVTLLPTCFNFVFPSCGRSPGRSALTNDKFTYCSNQRALHEPIEKSIPSSIPPIGTASILRNCGVGKSSACWPLWQLVRLSGRPCNRGPYRSGPILRHSIPA